MNGLGVLAAGAVALCLVFAGGPALAAGAPKEKGDDGPHAIQIGAFTFLVEMPLYKQYIVASISVELKDKESADKLEQSENFVRLRDAALTEMIATRPTSATGEVDVDRMTERVEEALSAWVPSLKGVEIALLGRHNVPRR